MVRKRTGKRMTLITVHLTDQQIAELDRLVRLHIFPNRSEAIRTAIRELIDKYMRRGVSQERPPLSLEDLEMEGLTIS